MNIALIGTGAMARRFLQAVQRAVREVRFVAAHSRDPQRLELFGKEYTDIECTTELSGLLARRDIDAVYISTPVDTHAPLSIAAAQAGKHVLCEKPMALNPSECRAMVEAAEASGVILQIGYMMRFHPAHQLIRRRIAEGDPGTLRFVHLERTVCNDFLSDRMPEHRKWFIHPQLSGGGALMDLGSHCLDLLLYLVDEQVASCTLQRRNEPLDDVESDALAVVRFESGLSATVFASWNVPLHDNIIQVYGDRASLFARRTLGPYTDGTVERITEAGREAIPYTYKNHYVLQLEHFHDCVAAGREPLTSGRACLPTERLRAQLYANVR